MWWLVDVACVLRKVVLVVTLLMLSLVLAWCVAEAVIVRALTALHGYLAPERVIAQVIDREIPATRVASPDQVLLSVSLSTLYVAAARCVPDAPWGDDEETHA